MTDDFDHDDPLPAMRMLAYTLVWCAVVILAFVSYLLYVNTEIIMDFFDKNGWLIALALLICYMIIDQLLMRQRITHGELDTGRIDAIERFGLVVVPPGKDGKYRVMHRDSDVDTPKLIGVGGTTYRAAIDSALLEITPPTRRYGDKKGV